MVDQVARRGRYDQADFRFGIYVENYPQKIKIVTVLPQSLFSGRRVVRSGHGDQTDFRFEILGQNYPQIIKIVNVLPQKLFSGR